MRGGDFTLSKPTKVGSPTGNDVVGEGMDRNAHRVAEIERRLCRSGCRHRWFSGRRFGGCTAHRESSPAVQVICWCRWVAYLSERAAHPGDVVRAVRVKSRSTLSILAPFANLRFQKPKSTDTIQRAIPSIPSWPLFYVVATSPWKFHKKISQHHGVR